MKMMKPDDGDHRGGNRDDEGPWNDGFPLHSERSSSPFPGTDADADADGTMIIVPGFQAHPENHWFPWLARTSRKHGVPCRIVDLPAPERPVCTEWTSATNRTCTTEHGRLTLVAHSLGCLALLKTMALHPGTFHGRLARLVMVSGFLDPMPVLPDIPGIGDFILTTEELAIVHDLLPASVFVLHSDDDPVVRPSLTRALATWMDAHAVSIPGGGHFLAREGFSRFDQVADYALGVH